MTSPCLKLGIGLGVRLAAPFAKGTERIVNPAHSPGLGEDHALIGDFAHQLVARLQVQGGANRLGMVVCALPVSLLLIIGGALDAKVRPW